MLVDSTLLSLDHVLSEVDDGFDPSQSKSRIGTGSDSSILGLRTQPVVMVVDDDPLLIEVVKAFLRNDGFNRILSTDDPASAVSMAMRERPNVLLLDLHMPHVDGLQVLQAIRQEQMLAGMPVIVLTAATDHDVKLKAFELGATDFLNKPVHAGELLVRLRNILKAKAYEDQLRFQERQLRLAAEGELQSAELIQSKLYPTTAPSNARLDLAGATYSCGNGCGDYFDYLTLPNHQLGLVVGDVSGHGMPAALRMVETRAYLRSLVKHQSDAGQLLTELNEFMVREAAYVSDGSDQFVTLFLATIDTEKRELRYAAAGHIGYLLSQSGHVRKLLPTGLPLGIADLPIETSELILLDVGDTLVIATDGIEESMAPSREQFGSERLLSVVRSCQPCAARKIVEELYSAVCQFTQGSVQRDDITAIVATLR